MLRLNKEWETKLGVFKNDRRAYYSFLIFDGYIFSMSFYFIFKKCQN